MGHRASGHRGKDDASVPAHTVLTGLRPALIYCFCFAALTILHVRNWFQKEAPSSKLKRTPPASARHKHLHNRHVTGTHLSAPAEAAKSTPAHVSHSSQDQAKGPAKPNKLDVLLVEKPLRCLPSIPGKQHLGSEKGNHLLSSHYLHGRAGQLGGAAGTFQEGSWHNHRAATVSLLSAGTGRGWQQTRLRCLQIPTVQHPTSGLPSKPLSLEVTAGLSQPRLLQCPMQIPAGKSSPLTDACSTAQHQS